MEYVQPDAVAMVSMHCSRPGRAQGSSCFPMATKEPQPTASGTGLETCCQEPPTHHSEPARALLGFPGIVDALSRSPSISQDGTSSWACIVTVWACQSDESGIWGEGGGQVLSLSELLLAWKLLGSSWCQCLPETDEKMSHCPVPPPMVVSGQIDK